MNAEAKVLQALDAAQAALRRMADADTQERARMAHDALEQLSLAPWSMVARADEADRNGWLSQIRDVLQRIEQEPDNDEIEGLADEGNWAANELERDLRRLVGAR